MGTLLNAGEPEFRVVYSEVRLTHRTFQTKNEAIQFALGEMAAPITDDDLAVRTVFNGASGLSQTILEGCGQKRVQIESFE
jgi:hypothetical protein